MPNIKARDADNNEVFYYSSQANTTGNPAKSAENVEAAINTLTSKLPASLGSTTSSGSLAVALSSDGPFSTAVGTPSQSEATTDTGSFTVLQFIKRGLQNWTTLLARIPVLVSGRVPVDGSGVTQPVSGTVTANAGTGTFTVSGPLTDTQLRATAVPVSGTVTANLGTLGGAATETTLTTLSGKFGTIGQKAMAASAPVVIASDQSAIPVVPTMSSGGNLSATTAATGTNWTAFGSQALRQLTISNQTGATLEFRQGGAGVGFQVPTANFYTFFGLTNANQIEVRRVDTTNTQVTVTARWES